MAVLQTIQGMNPGQCFPIEGEVAVLGRHPDCDIVLESGAVSRQHAQLLVIDGVYYVEDLGSRNGTFVNGQPVLERRALAENDKLAICDLLFVFRSAPPEPEAPEDNYADSEMTRAMMVDDAHTRGGSTIMSRLDVSSGTAGLLLAANTEAKLKALIEIGQSLGQALGLREVLPKLLDTLFRIFPQADRGFIVLADPATGRLIPEVIKLRRPDDEATLRISRTIVGSVMEQKEAILSADAAADSRFDMAESIVDFQIHSMMCAPLVGSEGNALGVIQIDAMDQRNRFLAEDLEVLASVACQASFAIENARLHEAAVREQALARELTLAHRVQQGFLPSEPPDIGGYSFFEFYDAAQQLGGDYFDYILLSEGRLAVVVADVSGKGISASLLMAKLSAETRYCLAAEAVPADAVTRLNRVFAGAGWEDRFVTMVLCVLNPATHEVTVVNAGHMSPLLRRADGEVEELPDSQTGLPLGVLEDFAYEQSSLRLEPGQSLALFTDGVTEAMNHANELYGSRRLCEQLRRSPPSIEEIGQAILDDVKRFVGQRSQSDDLCLVCFGRDGA